MLVKKIHRSRETAQKRVRIKKLNDKSKSFFDFVRKTAPKKSLDEHNSDPDRINENFVNLANERKKCLESAMEHVDVETYEKTI